MFLRSAGERGKSKKSGGLNKYSLNKYSDREIRLTVGFFLLAGAVFLIWAWIMPFNEGPDESMRSQIVWYIVEYGKLPTGYQEEIMDYNWGFTYAFRPILPQMLEAVFVRIAMIFTGDEFSLLFAGRLASVCCGLVYAAYVRKIALRLFENRACGRLFALLCVFLPQAAFLFTYINCDSMALMASAMIIWYLIDGMDRRFPVSVCVKLGISLSVCLLSYYNAYGFIVTAVIMYVFHFIQRRRGGERVSREFWLKGMLIVGIVALLAGWWFVRNYFLYDGDFLGLSTQNAYAEEYAIDILKPSNRQSYKNQGYSLLYMLFCSDFFYNVAKSFIGLLGPLYYALPWWMYIVFGFIFIFGAAGVVYASARWLKVRRQKRPISGEKQQLSGGEKVRPDDVKQNPESAGPTSGCDFGKMGFHLGMAAAVIIPNLLNIWYSYATDYQPQGRYSMPMLVPFMYYMAVGIEAAAGRIFRKRANIFTALLCAWVVFGAVYSLAGIMWPAYRDVEDKMTEREYTLEDFFGEDYGAEE